MKTEITHGDVLMRRTLANEIVVQTEGDPYRHEFSIEEFRTILMHGVELLTNKQGSWRFRVVVKTDVEGREQFTPVATAQDEHEAVKVYHRRKKDGEDVYLQRAYFPPFLEAEWQTAKEVPVESTLTIP